MNETTHALANGTLDIETWAIKLIRQVGAGTYVKGALENMEANSESKSIKTEMNIQFYT